MFIEEYQTPNRNWKILTETYVLNVKLDQYKKVIKVPTYFGLPHTRPPPSIESFKNGLLERKETFYFPLLLRIYIDISRTLRWKVVEHNWLRCGLRIWTLNRPQLPSPCSILKYVPWDGMILNGSLLIIRNLTHRDFMTSSLNSFLSNPILTH